MPKKYIAIFVVGILAVIAAFFYLGGEGGSGPVKPTADKKEAKQPAKPELQPLSPASPMAPSTPGAASQLTTAEEGDVLIDEILRQDKDTDAMARDLHELVKKLNGEAQVNASRHLVNLTSDTDYNLISGFLVDPKTNPEVIEVLFSDLMNRDRSLQLPLFMNILKNPQHPQNEEVRNVMTVLAGEDFENDFAAWDKWAAEELKSLQE